jgi:hypothetical protein
VASVVEIRTYQPKGKRAEQATEKKPPSHEIPADHRLVLNQEDRYGVIRAYPGREALRPTRDI